VVVAVIQGFEAGQAGGCEVGGPSGVQVCAELGQFLQVVGKILGAGEQINEAGGRVGAVLECVDQAAGPQVPPTGPHLHYPVAFEYAHGALRDAHNLVECVVNMRRGPICWGCR